MDKYLKGITHADLKKVLSYDAETGNFTWKIVKQGMQKNMKAGAQKSNGYIKICINKIQYHAHRLAWLYMTGEWPKKELDHINGVRSDNKWKNLREVTRTENNMNQKISSANTSGYIGVHWAKREQKWNAYIKKNRKRKHLGYFDNYEEAVAARKKAEKEYGFHANHGRQQ